MIAARTLRAVSDGKQESKARKNQETSILRAYLRPKRGEKTTSRAADAAIRTETMMREGCISDRAKSPRPAEARNDHRAGEITGSGVEDMTKKQRIGLSQSTQRRGVLSIRWYTVCLSLW